MVNLRLSDDGQSAIDQFTLSSSGKNGAIFSSGSETIVPSGSLLEAAFGPHTPLRKNALTVQSQTIN
jgi:hypothetical protein